jgi:hypothetical protein
MLHGRALLTPQNAESNPMTTANLAQMMLGELAVARSPTSRCTLCAAQFTWKNFVTALKRHVSLKALRFITLSGCHVAWGPASGGQQPRWQALSSASTAVKRRGHRLIRCRQAGPGKPELGLRTTWVSE